MSLGHAGGRQAIWNSATAFVLDTLAVAEAEARKLRHDPYELLTRAVQPALWLIVFGQVMGHIRGIPTGGLAYQAYLAPGILAQSSLFVAIFYGIAVIWERDLGILVKYIASPSPRGALVLGKGLAAGLRALSQAVIVYVLAASLRVPLRTSLANLLAIAAITVLGAAVFATFSLIVACIVKTRERFMGIGQILTMPLFFASNAIYPIDIMPSWLQRAAAANPLTYQVDALRALMLRGGHSTFGIAWDFIVLACVLVALISVASSMYARILD